MEKNDINKLVAGIAGWKHTFQGDWYPPGLHPLQSVTGHTIPKFTESWDAVLPVLISLSENKRDAVAGYLISILKDDDCSASLCAKPIEICRAILMAHNLL